MNVMVIILGYLRIYCILLLVNAAHAALNDMSLNGNFFIPSLN